MESVISLIIVLVVCFVLTLIIWAIISLCHDLTEKKRIRKHPKLWEWFDKANELMTDACHWYNEHIAPLKNKVDAILRDWNYYSESTKSQKEKELEELRKAIENAGTTYDAMCGEVEVIRSEIHDYVEQHNLEWARRWGW